MAKKMARPTDYTSEIADRISVLVSDRVAIRDICKLKDMPSRATFFRWLAKQEEFRDLYYHAKQMVADEEVEEIQTIADEVPKTNEHGFDGAYVNWMKLRIDARKWRAAKYAPKKYGDRYDVTSDNKALAVPGVLRVEIVTDDNMDERCPL